MKRNYEVGLSLFVTVEASTVGEAEQLAQELTTKALNKSANLFEVDVYDPIAVETFMGTGKKII